MNFVKLENSDLQTNRKKKKSPKHMCTLQFNNKALKAVRIP